LCFSVTIAKIAIMLRLRIKRLRLTGWSSASSAAVVANTLITRKLSEIDQ